MELRKDKLDVKIFETRDEMGKAAADDIAKCIKDALRARQKSI